MTVRLGTRGSALALAQAQAIVTAIERGGEPVEVVTVRTEGDLSDAPLQQIGGTGVFAGALRRSLAAGECDLVVHSLKDLPVEKAEGLTVAAVPPRADARDVLVARDGARLVALPRGAVVGTGSPRRRSQLLAARPDLEVRDIRGNVDTRLRRVREGDLDAVVLSWAGLERLGRLGAVSEALPLATWPTAAGQGALALEVRDADARHLVDPDAEPSRVGAVVAALGDDEAGDAVAAERRVLAVLEAGCSAPIGVASEVEGDRASVWAVVHRVDGRAAITGREDLVLAEGRRRLQLRAMAERVAARLLEGGAADLAPLGAAS